MPLMFETPTRRTYWNYLRDNPGHPWAADIKAGADAWKAYVDSGYVTPPRYNDGGDWVTFHWGITGDPVYAPYVKTAIQNGAAVDVRTPAYDAAWAPARNGTREEFWRLVWWANWGRSLFTQGEWDTLVAQIDNNWAAPSYQFDLEHAQGAGSATAPFWIDSDNTVGIFFAVVLWDLVTGRNIYTGDQNVSVSPQLIATSDTSQDTGMRNAVAAYCRAAALATDPMAPLSALSTGAEWIESTDYNPGTLKLLLMGSEGVTSLLGVNRFPEISARWAAFLRMLMMHASPGLISPYQWGDEPSPWFFDVYHWVQPFKILAGLLGNADEAKWARKFIQDIGWDSAAPWPFMYMFGDPNAPVAEFRGAMPNQMQSTQGLVFHRTGWGANDSHFSSYSLDPVNRVFVEHQVVSDRINGWLGDWALFRGNNWSVGHPQDYYNHTVIEPDGLNTVALAGLGHFANESDFYRELGTDYTYTRMRTDGQFYGYTPPASFVQEWTRSLLYLPQVASGPDIVLTVDRIKADPPTDIASYFPLHQSAIASHALKEVRVHTNVAATLSGNTASWTAANGLPVQVKYTTPADVVLSNFDESVWQTSTPNPSYKFHTVAKAGATRNWDVFFGVVQAGATAGTVTSLTSSSTRFQGVQITQTGQPDRIVYFSVNTAGRKQTTGDTFTFTAGANGANVMVFDLDPAYEWRRGGVLQTLTGSGMVRFTTATGAQSVALSSSLNSPPSLTAIPDKYITDVQQSINVSLAATDPDSDPITFTTSHSGFTYFPAYDGYGGVASKWFQAGGPNGPWFFILSNGNFYRWNGTAGANGTLIGLIGSAAYDNPTIITTPNITRSVTGATLTITRGTTSWYGAAYVSVTASDGRATDTQNFCVAAAMPATPLPQISSFTAARQSITAGETTSLTVAFSDAVNCKIERITPTPVTLIQTFTTSPGSVNVTPTVTSLYRATATNAASQTTTADRTITVVPQPVISAFTVNGAGSASITQGQSATLSVTFSNAVDCILEQISPTPVQLLQTFTTSPGTRVVTPTGPGTYQYRVTARNSLNYTVTQTVTLTVVAQPMVTLFSPLDLRLTFTDSVDAVVTRISPAPTVTVGTYTVSPATVVLTPPTTGTYVYRVTVRNTLGYTNVKDLTVSVP